MNRRELLKGIIATGVIALSPIKPALPAEAALPYVGRFQDLILRGRITIPVIMSTAPTAYRELATKAASISDIAGYSPKFGRFITRQEFESESVRLTPTY